MKKKVLLVLMVIGLTALIVIRLASNKNTIDKRNQPGTEVAKGIPVTVATAVEETLSTELVKTGTLAPFRQATVLATASGKLLRLDFELGTPVQEGQLLGRIDTQLLQLDLEKSESAAQKLRRDLQTYSELLEGNAATREKVEEVRQNYNEAANRSSQLRRQIADASLKAPISGVIASRPVEQGVFVASGSEVAAIVNLSRVKVTVNLTEAEVYQVSAGQKILLQTDVYPGREWQGTLSYISPQADAAHNYAVEISAENNREAPLRSGTFVRVDFAGRAPQKMLLIPREALLESTRDASVYVIQAGKAVLRPVKAGSDYGGRVAIIEGLKPGEQVVTSGQINLQSGTPVTISK